MGFYFNYRLVKKILCSGASLAYNPNMQLSKDQVKKVAKLANLPISEEEEETYSKQLSAIIDYIEQLKSVKTEGVEPTYNVTGKFSVEAKDEIQESLSQEEALKNSSNIRQGFFVTKGVFEEE